MLRLKLQYFGHLMQRVDSLENTLILGGIGYDPSPCKWHSKVCFCEFIFLLYMYSEKGMKGSEMTREELSIKKQLSVEVDMLYDYIQFSSVQLLSRVRLFVTSWIAARQVSLSITNSQSSLRLMSIESVMPSSHLILCRPLLLLPPIPPSITVFSNESTLRMRWPKYWSFSFSIIPSKEIPGLISFRMDWLDLLVVMGKFSICTCIIDFKVYTCQSLLRSNVMNYIW